MDHPRPGLRYMDAADLDRSAFDFDGIDVLDHAGDRLGTVDGFILDVDNGRPFHVVVEAGHWYKHKYFLVPIGHVRLDSGAKRLTADLPKARAERFPGFSRSEFEKLTDQDIEQLAYASAAVCGGEPIDTTVAWESWTHYEYPNWWDNSYYRPDGARTSEGSAGGAPSATSGGASRGTVAPASPANRDRERVIAQAGDVSPQASGRAQPGDVRGVEAGGEQRHVRDTVGDDDKVPPRRGKSGG